MRQNLLKKRDIKNPLSWFGSKARLSKYMTKMIPKHVCYVEVFGGSGWFLLKKKPSMVEVYNDIDSRLVNFFRVCRDPKKCIELKRLLQFTSYSRSEFNFCRDNPNGDSDIETARRFFVSCNQSFGGKNDSWGCAVMSNKRIDTNNSKEKGILSFAYRIKKVQIESIDFRELIPKYDRTSTFFYLDPSYVHGSRSEKNSYNNEMSNLDHKELVRILLDIKGKAILSGYENSIYKRLEKHG